MSAFLYNPFNSIKVFFLVALECHILMYIINVGFSAELTTVDIEAIYINHTLFTVRRYYARDVAWFIIWLNGLYVKIPRQKFN